MRRRRAHRSIGQSLRSRCAPLSLEALEDRRVLSSASLTISGAYFDTQSFGPSYLRVLDIEASGGEHVTEDSALTTPPAALDIGFSRAPLLTGGPASANNLANWQLLKDGVDVTSSIVGINYKYSDGWFSANPLTHVYLVFSSPLGPGEYRLTARGTINDLEGALPDAKGTDFVRNFRVLPVSADAGVKTVETVSGAEPQVSQPVVATAADGSYVMAWVQTSRTAAIDSTIILQRFTAGGQKLGDKITLAAASLVDSLSIAFRSDGGFVIGWSQDTRELFSARYLSLNSESATPQATAAEDGGWEVRAQRFDAQGNAIGDSLLVAESVAGSMGGAQVAATANGGFGIAWRATETNVDTIKFRQFDASGTPLTDEQTLGIGVGIGPRIAASASGAVVVWAEYSNADLTHPSTLGPVRGQRMDAAGAKLGDSFLVSGPQDVSPFAPDVAMDAEGNFIVVWQDGSPFDGRHVYAQRYDAAGQVVQSRFQVDGSVALFAQTPAVAMSARGNFVVSWVSVPPLHVDSGSYNSMRIKARAFDDTGVATGEEFYVDTLPTPQFASIIVIGQSRQLGSHSLAMAGENRLIVGWGQIDQSMDFVSSNHPLGIVTATSIVSRSFTLRSPQVDLNGAATGANYAGGFRPGLGPVAISGELAITNIAGDSLTSARVVLSGFLAGDVVSADTTGTSITASFAGGVLTLSGADSVEHYRQVLSSVRFDSTANRALGSKILLHVSVSDATQTSPPATATLTVYQSGGAWVAGRWLFYENSRWDNNTFGPSTLDDAAIAPDKTPLLPGQDSSFANISSSTRGLNGFMIDVGGQHGPLSIDDFILTVGNTADVDSWTAAPTPWMTIRPGAGVNGSDRIEFRFEHMAIKNQWLRVEMIASPNTGLTNSDVFYFGSLPGDTVAPHTNVTGVDAIRLVNYLIAQGELTEAAIDDPLDINRDGWISGGDIHSLVNVLYGGATSLVPLSIPAQAGSGQALPQLVGDRAFLAGTSGAPIDTTRESSLVGASSALASGVVAASDLGASAAASEGQALSSDGLVSPMLVVPPQGISNVRIWYIEASGDEHIEEGSALLTPPTSLDVRFGGSLSFADGPGSANNLANWQLLKDGVDVTSSIVAINRQVDGAPLFAIHFYLIFASPLGPGDYRLTARGTIKDLEGGLPKAKGIDFVRNFRVLGVSANAGVKTVETVNGAEPQVSRPVVATAADGSYVMAWVETSRTALIDSTIILQRFTADDQKLGSRITLAAASLVDSLSIAFRSDGGFVVGWSQDTRELIPAQHWPFSGEAVATQTTTAGDGGWEVRAQRYEAQGNPLGDTLLAAESVVDPMGGAQVAANANGGFGIVWHAGDIHEHSIYYRRYDALGAPLADPLVLDAGLNPQIAANAAGAVVVWAEQTSGDLTNPSVLGPVHGQRLDATGAKLGDSFLVSGPADDSPFAPDVAMDAEGNFVVVWQVGTLLDGQHVLAQRYNAAGQVVQSRFQVDGPGAIYAQAPAVAMSAGGNFVVSWVSGQKHRSAYEPLMRISARAFDDSGVAISEEFWVDTLPEPQFAMFSDVGHGPQLGQNFVAMTGENRLIVAWSETDLIVDFGSNVVATSILSRSFIVRSPLVDLDGVATGANYAGGFRPGLGPVAIGSALTIANVIGDWLTSAHAAIDGTLAGDVLTTNTAGTNIKASFVGGVLMLTGVDSVEHYQRVLRSITFNSSANRALGTQITLRVSVSDGAQTSPTATAALSVYQPGAAWVAGRWLFYDYSHWDNYTFGSSPGEDVAIAADKSALLPGQESSFANISSSIYGINGFMIDVGGPHGPLTAADFSLKVSKSTDVNTWLEAPAAWISIRPGAGVNGSDRVEFRFEGYEVLNKWLRVELIASPNTGLAANDVFYFGSLPGDTVAPHTGVMPVDAIRLVNYLIANGEMRAAAIDNPLDINRDGWINGGDLNSLFNILRSVKWGQVTTLAPLSIPAQAGAGQVLPQLVGDRWFMVGVSGGVYSSGGPTSGFEAAALASGIVAAESARAAVVSSPVTPAWQSPTSVAGAATSQAVAVALVQWADEAEADLANLGLADLDLPELSLVADLPAAGDEPNADAGLSLDP